MKPNRGNILGVMVNNIDLIQATQIIQEWIKNHDKNYVCVTPAHSIMDAFHDPEFQKILNKSGMTTPDGMAVVWIMRLLGFKETKRVYGPDLMNEVCRFSTLQNWKHFFYGGAPGVAEALQKTMTYQYPGLNVVGYYSPPFRELTYEEDEQILKQINRSCPDIVWVGISSPKQERWMYKHLGSINASVMIGVGAAFDFLSGNKKQAPMWMQKSGLEWLFRFLQEPKRLWKRYKQYPTFIFLVLLQLLRIKNFS